ncbi:MAG: helix-turn-helix transcriptional regulator [Saprospiraceae bacterium]|jgi:putative transcriptional regulator|nr:helix-turn-helix transcriptional regulator [Saprospiraceae bacterium]MBK8297268.1 helix-turn-helix transcriptional regulator [Saprospiraceae bacterium]
MKNQLKVFRAIKNMTQDELAKAVSVSRQTIYAIESSKYVPSTILALKLAAIFETAVENVFILEPSDFSNKDSF